MKRFGCIFLAIAFLSVGHTSKLSEFLNKMEADDKARKERELQQDMDFRDFAFHFEKRYIDEQGQRCRNYVFRARSNPYRHGYFTVCDEH